MLAEDYIPYPVDQSLFNRRARGLRYVMEAMRRDWLMTLGAEQATTYLIDTKPVPVVGYKRTKKRSDFRGSAEHGYCASRIFRL